MDKYHFRECLHELLTDMFGADAIVPQKGREMGVKVDGKVASIDLETLVGLAYIQRGNRCKNRSNYLQYSVITLSDETSGSYLIFF